MEPSRYVHQGDINAINRVITRDEEHISEGPGKINISGCQLKNVVAAFRVGMEPDKVEIEQKIQKNDDARLKLIETIRKANLAVESQAELPEGQIVNFNTVGVSLSAGEGSILSIKRTDHACDLRVGKHSHVYVRNGANADSLACQDHSFVYMSGNVDASHLKVGSFCKVDLRVVPQSEASEIFSDYRRKFDKFVNYQISLIGPICATQESELQQLATLDLELVSALKV